jgi:hypothetical protein
MKHDALLFYLYWSAPDIELPQFGGSENYPSQPQANDQKSRHCNAD